MMFLFLLIDEAREIDRNVWLNFRTQQFQVPVEKAKGDPRFGFERVNRKLELAQKEFGVEKISEAMARKVNLRERKKSSEE